MIRARGGSETETEYFGALVSEVTNFTLSVKVINYLDDYVRALLVWTLNIFQYIISTL